MLTPQRAIVRPHAIAPHSGEPLPLEDLVLEFLEERRQAGGDTGTIIQIGGEAGAGKSTALAHLAAVLPGAEEISFLDDESPKIALCRKLRSEPVIMAFGDEVLYEADAYFALAPWSEDDLLEYLLAAHPRQCGRLLNRIRQTGDGEPLQGNPELWGNVLEEFAAEPALPGVRAAIEKALARMFDRSEDRWYAEECCVAKLAGDLDRWLA